jgi:HEAT repeat protein
MRRSALTLAFALAGLAGCGKKPAPPAPGEAEKAAKADPAPPGMTERNKQIVALKTGRTETRRAAIEELSWLAEDDPAVVPALIELLRDKGTAGTGRTLANQINSTREAAALAILACTNGEQIMRDKGLPVLREGLTDPAAVVREHTAYTAGLLGAVGKPLAADVQKLCTDPDGRVRGVAFDALRTLGVADPVAFAKLLKHDNEEVVRLTAELLPTLSDVPAEAITPLTEALASDNSNVRAAAAEGLARAGEKAAPAVPLLVEAIRKSYPDEYQPMSKVRLDGPDQAYWRALAAVGAPAVEPTAKLFDHPNALVRQYAARALGVIGEPSKAALEPLKKALDDKFVNVVIEAAVTLGMLGEAREQALSRMKQALEQTHDGVAAAAIEGIPKLGPVGRELVPLALEKLSNVNPQTRLAAITLVGDLPPELATKHAAEVAKHATDADADIRRRVGKVLAHLGATAAPAAELLGKAAADEKELDIRDLFIEALVSMGPAMKPALPGLLPLTAEADVNVALRARLIAAVAAADPGSPAVAAALVKVAADSDATVQTAAAAALGRLDPLPPEALATLVKMAKSSSKTVVRAAAFRALAAAGPRAKAAKPDVDALTANPQAGLAVWAKVAQASLDGKLETSGAAVRAWLTDRNGQVRGVAVEALLLIGPTPADLPALQKLLKDASGATKAAAAEAIGRLGPAAKDAVPALKRLLDDRDVELRIAAADALGAIGPDAQPAAGRLKELLADPAAHFAAQRALARIGAK